MCTPREILRLKNEPQAGNQIYRGNLFIHFPIVETSQLEQLSLSSIAAQICKPLNTASWFAFGSAGFQIAPELTRSARY
jgi:hypothetical protein